MGGSLKAQQQSTADKVVIFYEMDLIQKAECQAALFVHKMVLVGRD